MRYLLIVLLPLLSLSNCELIGGGNKEINGGEVAWKIKNQDILTVSTQPAIDTDNVYLIQDAKLKSFTLSDGSNNWNKQICSPGRTCDYSRTIPQTEDKLFIEQGFDIQAHSKSTGQIIWKTDITDNSEEVSGIGSPIMSQDEDYLYAGRSGYVVKLHKSDGKIVRRYPLDRLVPEGVVQGSTEPVISPFGDDILYVPTSYFDHSQPTPAEASGGNIFAFDATSGNIIWERHVTVTVPNTYTEEPEDSLTTSPEFYDIAVNENSIVAIGGSVVLSLDRFTGETQWTTLFTGDRADGFDVGLVVHNDGVYIASAGWHATKLDLETGKILWRRDINFSNTSIPTVRDGRLYFSNSGGGGIWVLDTAGGSVIYHKNTPNHGSDSFDVYISSLAVGQGYMVNVGSKAVYCLKVP